MRRKRNNTKENNYKTYNNKKAHTGTQRKKTKMKGIFTQKHLLL